MFNLMGFFKIFIRYLKLSSSVVYDLQSDASGGLWQSRVCLRILFYAIYQDSTHLGSVSVDLLIVDVRN